MIEFVNLTKKFQNNFWEKEFYALNDVSFNIQQGDLVGFLGANGAGKTTLIKILMDFSRQTSGRVNFSSILGNDPLTIKSNIGYLPERAYLYQYLTGREFLDYIGHLNGIKKASLHELTTKWAAKMQIDHALDRQIRGYSKGMQQRLGFISTVIHNPKFLILDEPLSGLDPIGRRDFKQIMKELNEDGVTIFFSSHIVADVEEVCNKVVFIEKGKLIYNGGIKDLILKNSHDQSRQERYTVRYLKNQEIETLSFTTAEKNKILGDLLENKMDIIELEKEKLTLEEIVYKIKR